MGYFEIYLFIYITIEIVSRKPSKCQVFSGVDGGGEMRLVRYARSGEVKSKHVQGFD